MFQSRTVVVVGAGASFEVGLPIGARLKEEISKLTSFTFEFGNLKYGDGDFYNEIRRLPEFAKEGNRAIAACRKISNGIGFVSSIDSFLEVHSLDPDIQACAKAAIAKIVTDQERRSRLYVDPSNIYNSLKPANIQETWFVELAHMLFEKVDSGQLRKAFEPVTFVSFNYDRCVEWFVFNALKGLYFLDDRQAQDVLHSMQVLHPYGDIGAPSWLRGSGGVPFGGEVRGRLGELAKGIRTFTEKMAVSDTVDQVRKAIADARTVVFLGFAFHPQNMELLVPGGTISGVQQVYGTAVGMSERDRKATEEYLNRSFTRPSGKVRGPTVQLVDLECSEFMRQFKRTLAVQ